MTTTEKLNKERKAFRVIGQMVKERAKRKYELMRSVGYTKFGADTDKEVFENRTMAKICEELAEICGELVKYERRKRKHRKYL